MDVPHDRSQVRMTHDRGQRKRVCFDFRPLPGSEGMPEIVKHEGNACFPTRAVGAVVQLGYVVARIPLARKQPRSVRLQAISENLQNFVSFRQCCVRQPDSLIRFLFSAWMRQAPSYRIPGPPLSDRTAGAALSRVS